MYTYICLYTSVHMYVCRIVLIAVIDHLYLFSFFVFFCKEIHNKILHASAAAIEGGKRATNAFALFIYHSVA